MAWTAGSMIVNTSFLMKDNSSNRCTNYFQRKKFNRNFDRISDMACPRASCRIELRPPARHPNMPAPEPHETYIPFRNYRNNFLARATLRANSQVNTGMNRCLP